jgi:hypothetical protein
MEKIGIEMIGGIITEYGYVGGIVVIVLFIAAKMLPTIILKWVNRTWFTKTRVHSTDDIDTLMNTLYRWRSTRIDQFSTHEYYKIADIQMSVFSKQFIGIGTERIDMVISSMDNQQQHREILTRYHRYNTDVQLAIKDFDAHNVRFYAYEQRGLNEYFLNSISVICKCNISNEKRISLISEFSAILFDLILVHVETEVQ